MNEQDFLKGIERLSMDRKKKSMAAILKKMGYRRGAHLLEKELRNFPKRHFRQSEITDKPELPATSKKAVKEPIETKQAATSSRLVTYKPGDLPSKYVQSVSGERNKDKRVVIREAFPFLSEDDCPDILKILVADMLTAHGRYVKGHDRLFEVAHKSTETCFEAAKVVVENYIENRLIWAELEHYQKTKTLLGEHPLFELQRKKEKALKMKEVDLLKAIDSVRKKILHRKELLKKDPDHERGGKWLEELSVLQDEKKELDKIKKHRFPSKKKVFV